MGGLGRGRRQYGIIGRKAGGGGLERGCQGGTEREREGRKEGQVEGRGEGVSKEAGSRGDMGPFLLY